MRLAAVVRGDLVHMPRWRAVAVLVGLALVASACSSSGRGEPASEVGGTGAAPASSSDVTGATRLLESSAKAVRAQVDALVQPLHTPNGGQRQVIVDDAGPCQIGAAGLWPQRWGYAVTVTLAKADAAETAASLQRRLQGQGWTIRSYDTTSDAVDFDARKSDLVLRVNGEPSMTLTIEGYGVCVGGDGQAQAV
jgi:hypothetical protein